MCARVAVVEQEIEKISDNHVRRTLKRMKSGKGSDNMLVEVWTCLREVSVMFLTGLFNKILKTEDN